MIETNCPACGAPLVFRTRHALLAVCSYCQSTIVRHDLDLTNLGRMADVREDHTPLKIGASGNYQGTPFEVVGRLQVAFDGGTWNEWYCTFADGREGWLGESNGSIAVLFEQQGATAGVPGFEALKVGALVPGLPSPWLVTDKRQARVVGAQGEIPFQVGGGYPLPYADLQGSGAQFATLDFSEGQPRFFYGHWTRLADLKMKGLREFEHFSRGEATRRELLTRAMNCPNCASPIQLRVPGQTQHIGCPSCGSLLSAEDDNVKLLRRWTEQVRAPLIPIGSRGVFGGKTFEVLGMMTRAVSDEGEWYPWDEYLLFNPYEGYRWLVLSNGHFSFVEPVLGQPSLSDGFSGGLSWRGQHFKHFTTGMAHVQYVLGEFYWKVKVGDQAMTEDFISPPTMLSKEVDGHEIVWSVGTWMTGQQVWEAFKLEGRPPRASGIAPHQPLDPEGNARKIYVTWVTAAFALIAVTLIHSLVAGHDVVLTLKGEVSSAVNAGEADPITFSEPFTIAGRTGAVELRTQAGLSNEWLELEIALVEEGKQDALRAWSTLEEWHGSGWREGEWTQAQVVGPVPPGQYTVKVTPTWQKWAPGTDPGKKIPWTLTLVHDVPRFGPALAALLLLSLLPLGVKLREMGQEAERWRGA